MSQNTRQCPICMLANQQIMTEHDYGNNVTYNCERCGRFTISRRAETIATRENKSAKLSGWLRERNINNIEIPILNLNFMEELLETLPRYTPLDKQKKLLQAVETLTDYPGKEVVLIPEHEVSLAWAENKEEFEYYIKSLMDRGLLEIPNQGRRTISDPLYPMVITATGWEYLEKERTNMSSKSQAFVAMTFDPNLKSVYDNAIASAIDLTGYRPYRVDAEPHLDRIDAKIVAEIKNSRFLIADVTQQKPGVYYEAGFAQGLGIPVIWSVRSDDLDNVHFDTRQYSHILWESEEELKEKLHDVILAVIGKKSTNR